MPGVAPGWQRLIRSDRCCRPHGSGSVSARVLGPRRTQFVEENSSSILRLVEEHSVSAYGAGDRNCVAVACADHRNEICGDLTIASDVAWLTESACAIRWMIETSGRHEFGYLSFFRLKICGLVGKSSVGSAQRDPSSRSRAGVGRQHRCDWRPLSTQSCRRPYKKRTIKVYANRRAKAQLLSFQRAKRSEFSTWLFYFPGSLIATIGPGCSQSH